VIEEGIRIIALTALAFVGALVVTPIWLRVLESWGFGKSIRTTEETPVFSQLHQKKAGTLNGGGFIIWGTVTAIALVLWGLGAALGGFFERLSFVSRAETYLPLAALVLAGTLGFLDDWFNARKKGGAKGGGLTVKHKIVIYTALAALGAWWFYVRLGFDVIQVPFYGSFEIGVWYVPVFMFILIASAFSANETDGLDGLLGGVSLFAFLALTAVAFAIGRYDLAVFGGAVIGALLAFLWYNIHPARFFMGDTGSMALGITIGTIAMLTNTALFLPFFAAILVFESLSVIIQVFSKKVFKRKVFRSAPIHHHFEALGWPESQVTMRFWIIAAMASALGLLLYFLARFF
jgi:phospho-N-acetylmuramoyl-pentapeptide-transferase